MEYPGGNPCPAAWPGTAAGQHGSLSADSYENEIVTGFDVHFLPENKVLQLSEPTPLSDAAALADLLIDHPCGSNASCGKCRVCFHQGAPDPMPADLRLLSSEEIAHGWRLACQCVLAGPAILEIPPVSRVFSAKGFGPDTLFSGGFEPFVRRQLLDLPLPDMKYQWALEDSFGKQWRGKPKPELSLDQIRELERAVQVCRRICTVADGNRVLRIAPAPDGLRKNKLFGLALDTGSTSLAAALVDLETGAVASFGSMLNPQVRYGADVISRIDFAQSSPTGNEQLHSVLIDALNSLFAQIIGQAGADKEDVWSVCAVGNPAMLHSLAGIDIVPLGQSPYVGAWTRGRVMEASDIGLDFHAGVRLRLFPMIRSTVGGDTVAAAIAAGIDLTEKLTLIIDLGTNCEVVLGNRDRIIATSTAAGPAFEGANIRYGMRAAPGAIDRVSLRPEGRLSIRVLGGVKAKGLCGSGLIDVVSVLLRGGLIDPSGRMRGADALDLERYPEMAWRIMRNEEGQLSFILATAEESERGCPILLTAHDVRQLQLIKGSILAGTKLLLQEYGATQEDISQILVAGAFGSYLRKSSALDIGLVPPIDPERVQFIGNAAGVGARMALVDRHAWRRAEAIRELADYLELGGHADYQEIFAEAMGFYDSPALETP